MSTKHSPTTRLAAAKRALTAAEIACAHWDIGGAHDANDSYSCCYDLHDAQLEVRAARRVYDIYAESGS